MKLFDLYENIKMFDQFWVNYALKNISIYLTYRFANFEFKLCKYIKKIALNSLFTILKFSLFCLYKMITILEGSLSKDYDVWFQFSKTPFKDEIGIFFDPHYEMLTFFVNHIIFKILFNNKFSSF